MSLLLGKTSTNTSILHITAGVNTDTQMLGSPLSNTVFHSELPYTTWVEQPCSVVNVRGITFIEISAEVGGYIASNRIIYFVTIGSSIIQGCQVVNNFPTSLLNSKYGAWYSYDNYLGGFYQPKGYPDGTFRLFLPPYGSDLSNVHVYTLNIFNGVYQGINKTDNEISVKRTEIKVRGVNLLNLKYINNGKINNSDIAYYLGSTQIQLINSYTPVSTILSIISNRVESSIYRNNEAIFSSLSRGSINYGGIGSTSIAGVSGSTRSITITLPTECIGSICYLDFFGADIPEMYANGLGIPVLIKVGSGDSFYVYRNRTFDTDATVSSIIISSSSNTITITNFATGSHSLGIVSINYIYFK